MRKEGRRGRMVISRLLLVAAVGGGSAAQEPASPVGGAEQQQQRKGPRVTKVGAAATQTLTQQQQQQGQRRGQVPNVGREHLARSLGLLFGSPWHWLLLLLCVLLLGSWCQAHRMRRVGVRAVRERVLLEVL
jgi:hypothetical protein